MLGEDLAGAAQDLLGAGDRGGVEPGRVGVAAGGEQGPGLAAAQAGDSASALKLLRGGDYVKSSVRVKMLLARMFVIASEGAEAIDTHVSWKERLHAFISGSSQEDLKVEIVSRDDLCSLGHWIHGIGGERFGQTPAFSVVRSRHAHFHRCAGEVLAMVSKPSYDLNLCVDGIDQEHWALLHNSIDRRLLNRALRGTYPQG